MINFFAKMQKNNTKKYPDKNRVFFGVPRMAMEA
jgi:hypothetical protein